MQTTNSASDQKLYEDLVDALNTLFGRHPGFRAVHAKGLVCHGFFSPTTDATKISRSAHFKNTSTPVIVRFSNFSGIPGQPDGDPASSPRGFAVRFQTEAGDSDIVAHSFDGFPVATAEEFLQLARALAASGPDAPSPSPIENLAAGKPAVAHFLSTPKPIPESFANESFYGVNAFRFINSDGQAVYGRYRIEPVAGNKYLPDTTAAAQPADFLQKELTHRLTKEAVEFRLMLQIAEEGDPIDDGSQAWPADRKQVLLGVISVQSVDLDSADAQRKLIFDPIHLTDGIELGPDPLPAARSAIYSVSYARRNPG